MPHFFVWFALLLGFTLLGLAGITPFEAIRDDHLPLRSFAFFCYACFGVTGMFLLSPFRKSSRTRVLLSSASRWLRTTLLGFAGAIIGWSTGLLLWELLFGQHQLISTALIRLLDSVLISLGPFALSQLPATMDERRSKMLFAEREHQLPVRVAGLTLLVAGVVGLALQLRG